MDQDTARQRALALLARRDVSRSVLARRLASLGASDEVVEAVLADLVAWGYLDDERMAAALTRRKAGQGFGPRRIRHDLRSAGLTDRIVPDVIDDGLPDWQARAREIWRRRYGESQATDAREHARRVRYMLSRGFTWEQVRACLAGTDDDFPGADEGAGDDLD